MMDYQLNSSLAADNQKISTNMDNSLGELSYLHDHLDIAVIEIQAAVSAVGGNPERVERYLRDRLGFTNRD